VRQWGCANRGFYKLHQALVGLSQVSAGARLLYALLRRPADLGLRRWPGLDRLAVILGCWRSTVQALVENLVRAGVLVVQRNGPRGWRRYEFPPLPSEDFWMVPAFVAENPALSPAARLVYGRVFGGWKLGERVNPSITQLSRELHLHPRTIKESLLELGDCGLLLVEPISQGRSVAYRLDAPPECGSVGRPATHAHSGGFRPGPTHAHSGGSTHAQAGGFAHALTHADSGGSTHAQSGGFSAAAEIKEKREENSFSLLCQSSSRSKRRAHQRPAVGHPRRQAPGGLSAQVRRVENGAHASTWRRPIRQLGG